MIFFIFCFVNHYNLSAGLFFDFGLKKKLVTINKILGFSYINPVKMSVLIWLISKIYCRQIMDISLNTIYIKKIN